MYVFLNYLHSSIIAHFLVFVKYFIASFNLSPIKYVSFTEMLMLSTSYPQACPLFNAFFFGTFLYLGGFRYILVVFYPSPVYSFSTTLALGSSTYGVLDVCTGNVPYNSNLKALHSMLKVLLSYQGKTPSLPQCETLQPCKQICTNVVNVRA